MFISPFPFPFHEVVPHLFLVSYFLLFSTPQALPRPRHITYTCPSRPASPIHAHHPASAEDSEADGHLDAVLNDVELAAADLVPVDGDLGDLDAGAAANNRAVVAEDWDGGGRLGQHQHLDVEDPALGVHVGDDVGQGGAREQLEAALGVADARGGGGRQDHEDEVEGAHEEVAQRRALNHGVAADQVAPAADGDAPVASVDDFLAALDQFSQVAKPGSAVGVGEESVFPTHVAQTMGDTAALAAVLLERYDSQDIM